MSGRGVTARFSTWTQSRRAQKVALFAVLFFIAASLWLMNAHTPLQLDDYDYSVSWATGERIASLQDIIASQAAHYKLWGGRSIVHGLTQLFLLLGKPVFNVANTLMYMLLLLEITYMARRKIDWFDVLIVHGTMLLCLPFFGTVFLWLDGACNYLWGTVLALLPLIITEESEDGVFAKCGLRSVLAVFLCFLAGWTNENTACGVLAGRAVWLAYRRTRHRTVKVWEWISLLAETVGVLILLLAPGNFARAGGGILAGGTVALAKRTCVTMVYVGAYAAVPFMCVCFAAVIKEGSKKRLTEETAALFFTGLLCGLAMMGSPELSERTFTGMVALLLAAALGALRAAFADRRGVMRAKWLSAVPMILLLALTTRNALRQVEMHEAVLHSEMQSIERSVAAGQDAVYLKDIHSRSKYTQDILWGKSETDWPNSTLSKLYQIAVRGADHSPLE